MRDLSVFAILAATLSGCAQAPVQPVSTAGIEAVVPGIASQFSACNLDALMAIYAPNIEFLSPSTPRPLVGLAAVRDHLAGACAAGFRPLMAVESQSVRMLSPESAVVTGRYTIGRSDKPADKPWPALFVVTAQKIEGRWLATTQATVPAP